jgi:hypothetical protein
VRVVVVLRCANLISPVELCARAGRAPDRSAVIDVDQLHRLDEFSVERMTIRLRYLGLIAPRLPEHSALAKGDECGLDRVLGAIGAELPRWELAFDPHDPREALIFPEETLGEAIRHTGASQERTREDVGGKGSLMDATLRSPSKKTVAQGEFSCWAFFFHSSYCEMASLSLLLSMIALMSNGVPLCSIAFFGVSASVTCDEPYCP